MKIISAAFAVLYLSMLACFAPDRLPPPKEKPQELPKIVSQTNWGTLTQQGDSLTISGHPQWSAFGTVDPKTKKVTITWIELATGRLALSMYDADNNGDMRGFWDFDADIVNGMLVGDDLRPDVVARIKE